MKRHDPILRQQLFDQYNTPIAGEDCVTFHHMQLVINAVRKFDEKYQPPVSFNQSTTDIISVLFSGIAIVSLVVFAIVN